VFRFRLFFLIQYSIWLVLITNRFVLLCTNISVICSISMRSTETMVEVVLHYMIGIIRECNYCGKNNPNKQIPPFNHLCILFNLSLDCLFPIRIHVMWMRIKLKTSVQYTYREFPIKKIYSCQQWIYKIQLYNSRVKLKFIWDFFF